MDLAKQTKNPDVKGKPPFNRKNLPMNENPYTPPRACIDDAQEVENPKARPIQVTLAINLWAANICIGFFLDPSTKPLSAGSLLSTLLLPLILLVWLLYKIYLGRNWARITWLVMSLIGGLVLAGGHFRGIASDMPMPSMVGMLISVGINLVVLWLLFFSAGRRWFSARKKPSAALSASPPDAA